MIVRKTGNTINTELPEAGKNMVFGGDYGTCFDVSLLLEEGKEGMPVFKMWFS